jgi:hypothetical protein
MDVGGGPFGVSELFREADLLNVGVFLGVVLDFRVAAGADGHEEVFVVGAAGENRDDVVAVEFIEALFFAAQFADGVFFSAFAGDAFPIFVMQELSDGVVETLAVGPAVVVLPRDVFPLALV